MTTIQERLRAYAEHLRPIKLPPGITWEDSIGALAIEAASALDERERRIDTMNGYASMMEHLILSNHGYKPDACSACGDIGKALAPREARP